MMPRQIAPLQLRTALESTGPALWNRCHANIIRRPWRSLLLRPLLCALLDDTSLGSALVLFARSCKNSGSTHTVFIRLGSSSTFPYLSNHINRRGSRGVVVLQSQVIRRSQRSDRPHGSETGHSLAVFSGISN